MFTFIFAAVVFLLFIWRIHRGFENGIMQEVVNILSGAISFTLCCSCFLCHKQCGGQSDEHLDSLHDRIDFIRNYF